jgi:2,3-bisphosphoglycerate-independent phosphoglycerate mutase
MKSIQNLSKRVLLVIMDGFGMAADRLKNAALHAETPNLDKLFTESPYTQLEAGGIKVGLMKGVMGNSEVGHLNLGAGRSIRQDLVRINEAIENNSLKEQPEMKNLIQKALDNSKRIHLMGLLSDGAVHSHIDHLISVANILSKEPDIEIYYHAFMDGRDTPRDEGVQFLKTIIEKIPQVRLASIGGRSFGMDRDQRYEKIKTHYDCLTGKNKVEELPVMDYLQNSYQQKIYDEFITPALFIKEGTIQNEDCMFFLNFRPDRAIEITESFCLKDYPHFERKVTPVHFLCMTPYVDEYIKLPVLFTKEKVSGGLSETLASQNKTQYKIAETEKYAHVTYFFNGGERTPFEGEIQKLIPSPRDVKTYDEKPEMSAFEVLENLSATIQNENFDFHLVNFANPDMVGHTGNYQAAIKAVETVDYCVGELVKVCEENQITLLVTADHGNCDQMVYDDGRPHTSHSKNPVPFCLHFPNLSQNDVKINNYTDTLALRDVAPTVLNIMGLEPPKHFEGQSIFL